MKILTLQEIQYLSCLSRQAIHQHRIGTTSTPLPEPTQFISGSPVWIDEDRDAVLAWIDKRSKAA